MAVMKLLRRLIGGRSPAGIELEDMEGYRRLSGHDARDLDPVTQDRMQNLAEWLWQSNPLANRLVELPVAYLLAEGVRIEVDSEEAQGWLAMFWNDPINDIETHLPEWVRDLSLMGEQCWVMFKGKNGVRMASLDVRKITRVVHDPEHSGQVIGVVVDTEHGEKRYRVIVGDDEKVFSLKTQQARERFNDGECFYFAINRLTHGRRGRSDLLPVMDWLDAYDQYLFGEVERTGFLRGFVWDVELHGASPEDVENRAKNLSPPRPGSVRVHNEGEKWSAVAPSLNAGDTETAGRLFRNHVLGGASMPEHWFGGGGDVNRATAHEMGEPSFKIYSARQRFVGSMLRQVASYVIRHHLGKRKIAENQRALWQPRVVWPELTARDTSNYAQALGQVVGGVRVAVAGGLLTPQRAVAMIEAFSGRLGVSFDPEKEVEAAEEKETERRERDVDAQSV